MTWNQILLLVVLVVGVEPSIQAMIPGNVEELRQNPNMPAGHAQLRISKIDAVIDLLATFLEVPGFFTSNRNSITTKRFAVGCSVAANIAKLQRPITRFMQPQGILDPLDKLPNNIAQLRVLASVLVSLADGIRFSDERFLKPLANMEDYRHLHDLLMLVGRMPNLEDYRKLRRSMLIMLIAEVVARLSTLVALCMNKKGIVTTSLLGGDAFNLVRLLCRLRAGDTFEYIVDEKPQENPSHGESSAVVENYAE